MRKLHLPDLKPVWRALLYLATTVLAALSIVGAACEGVFPQWAVYLFYGTAAAALCFSCLYLVRDLVRLLSDPRDHESLLDRPAPGGDRASPRTAVSDQEDSRAEDPKALRHSVYYHGLCAGRCCHPPDSSGGRKILSGIYHLCGRCLCFYEEYPGSLEHSVSWKEKRTVLDHHPKHWAGRCRGVHFVSSDGNVLLFLQRGRSLSFSDEWHHRGSGQPDHPADRCVLSGCLPKKSGKLRACDVSARAGLSALHRRTHGQV